jgi:DNA repair exonuclease SbcCD nuclease subunit
MQFAHLSDSHLGYRQYGLVKREDDFIQVFQDAIDEVVSERPDFAVHSGDLFEYSRPPVKAILAAQTGFEKLREAGIPVYCVPGNHDIVMRRNSIPPQVLFKEVGVRVLSPQHPFHIHDGVFIGGAPYASKYHRKYQLERLEQLKRDSEGHKKKVLVLHQGLNKYIPVDYELELEDLPVGFDYYAMGHIHDRIVDEYGGGVLAYAGSSEMWRFNELPDYLKNGKGFYLVDISGDMAEVEKIDLRLPRELIKKSIQIQELDESLTELSSHIGGLGKPPLVMVMVKGGNLNRGEVYDRVNGSLKDVCLSLRTQYKPSEMATEATNREDGALTIEGLVREKLEVFKSDEVTELGVGLMKELSDGDIQVANGMVSDFYDGVKG